MALWITIRLIKSSIRDSITPSVEPDRNNLAWLSRSTATDTHLYKGLMSLINSTGHRWCVTSNVWTALRDISLSRSDPFPRDDYLSSSVSTIFTVDSTPPADEAKDRKNGERYYYRRETRSAEKCLGKLWSSQFNIDVASVIPFYYVPRVGEARWETRMDNDDEAQNSVGRICQVGLCQIHSCSREEGAGLEWNKRRRHSSRFPW